jgi:hypothetical protein
VRTGPALLLCRRIPAFPTSAATRARPPFPLLFVACAYRVMEGCKRTCGRLPTLGAGAGEKETHHETLEASVLVRLLFVAALVAGALGGVGVRSATADPFLLVSDFLENRVLRYDGTTGAFIDVFVPSISRPEYLAFGPDGNLYVT